MADSAQVLPHDAAFGYDRFMARWPRHVWTTIFTYGLIFVAFPLLCLLAYAWVRGWFDG